MEWQDIFSGNRKCKMSKSWDKKVFLIITGTSLAKYKNHFLELSSSARFYFLQSTYLDIGTLAQLQIFRMIFFACP